MGIPGLGGPGPYCIGMMGREYPGGGPFTENKYINLLMEMMAR